MCSRLLLFAALLGCLVSPVCAQWDLEDPPTTADLRGVDNTGGGAVWASGTHGVVVRSEDGGYMWQHCAVPPGAENLDFRGIQAWDENAAVVMSSGKGDQSRIYKTTDGCATWRLVFTNPDRDGFWDTIRFRRGSGGTLARVGYLIGDPVDGQFPIFETTDGGDTWHRMEEGSARAEEGEGLFAASNTCLAFPNSSSIAFVTGGPKGARLLWRGSSEKSFSSLQLPLARGSHSTGAFSVAALPGAKAGGAPGLMIVGGDYKSAGQKDGTAVFVRMNGARAKTVPSAGSPSGYRSAVAYDSTHRIWIAVGPNGTDVSRNNGRTWQALKPLPNEAPDADQHWNALSLPFAVGPHGRIGRWNENVLHPGQ